MGPYINTRISLGVLYGGKKYQREPYRATPSTNLSHTLSKGILSDVSVV